MVQKRLLCPERVRKIPKQFSWIDQRLVRDRHIERLSHRTAALYLFLVTVADARGLSYYSDPGISQRLGMDTGTLDSARQELVRVGLIAYQSPLYQVLDLEQQATTSRPSRLYSLQQIFKQMGGAHD
jgi:hypothetical protein